MQARGSERCRRGVDSRHVDLHGELTSPIARTSLICVHVVRVLCKSSDPSVPAPWFLQSWQTHAPVHGFFACKHPQLSVYDCCNWLLSLVECVEAG